MGYGEYSVSARSLRATVSGYETKKASELFTQSSKMEIHPDMRPQGLMFRECRDSEKHPNTVPIQLYLDTTGSMGKIPEQLLKNGLPTLMSRLIQNGVTDASLMFGAIGDHECDKFPLQVGQFESGDEELDMWLTRTYIESGGGGNAGESYLLAWYFAANHVTTDAAARGQKGFVFTIGDEPTLERLPNSAISSIMGKASQGGSLTAEELLDAARRTNHVCHIFVEHGGRRCENRWKELMGQDLIVIDNHEKVAQTISDYVLSKATTHKIKAPSTVVSTEEPSIVEEQVAQPTTTDSKTDFNSIML